jgi:hypothetical protein
VSHLPGDVQRLVKLVKEAEFTSAEVKEAQRAHKAAIERLTQQVGGDGLAAIANGHAEIGRLMTKKRPPEAP